MSVMSIVLQRNNDHFTTNSPDLALTEVTGLQSLKGNNLTAQKSLVSNAKGEGIRTYNANLNVNHFLDAKSSRGS